jgi:Bacterial Ig-like domain (group 3)/FG-GAP-like repeat
MTYHCLHLVVAVSCLVLPSSTSMLAEGPKAATTTILEASPTPIAPGEAMRLVATVSSSVVGGDQVTGTITFSNGPNALGVVPIADGRAVFSTTALPIGSNISLTAYYSGNTEFNWSVSPPLHLTTLGRLRPISTIELSISPAQQVTRGTVVTLSANVLDAGNPLPVGLVSFYSTTSAHPGKTIVGQVQLNANGVATMKFRPPLGSLEFQAIYQGTNTHAGCESTRQSLTVTGEIATRTTLSVDPANYSATVTAYGPLAASGDVFFADATNSGIELASAPLGPSNSQFFVSRPTSIDVGWPQYLLKVADFNGDGILDAAVVGFESDSTEELMILLGNPDGTFTQKSTISAIVGDLTVADFNGDGIPDIAVLQDDGPTTVLVLLGRGDGTFIAQPSVDVFSFYGASSIVSADFNGDGNPDLLMTNYNDGSTAVLLGNGEGGFRTIPSPNLGGESSEAIVADFNGDGIPDVAVFTLISEVFALQPTLSILSGNGDGTFVTSSLDLPCDEDSGIAVADFNGDGSPDIAVTNCYNSQDLDLLLGNGNTTFTSLEVPGAVGDKYADPIQVATGDLNGDGIPDLVLENPFDAEIGILLGKGDGTFLTGPVFPVPGGAEEGEVAVADFNGDGISDLLTTATDSYYPGDENVTTMFEWLSSVAQTSQATAAIVTLPGSGTGQVRALYSGDTTHIGSVSATAPAASAEPAHQKQ